jgi:hypothetical protein
MNAAAEPAMTAKVSMFSPASDHALADEVVAAASSITNSKVGIEALEASMSNSRNLRDGLMALFGSLGLAPCPSVKIEGRHLKKKKETPRVQQP